MEEKEKIARSRCNKGDRGIGKKGTAGWIKTENLQRKKCKKKKG